MDGSLIKHFLLKFDVTGVNAQTITNAKIRLYNTDAASAGGKFYHVNDDSWQEETVTWANAPTAETTLLAQLGAVSINTWYEVDVTSLVTGDGHTACVFLILYVVQLRGYNTRQPYMNC